MATRTTLLNGNVINRDTDFSKHIEAVSEAGVIKGLTVSSSSVAVGEAFVKCERTNGDIIYAVVYNTSEQSISGDGDVYIKIPQELIDNGELANEDGTGIATIEVGTMPAKNALKLATKSGNTITDRRNMIKKVGELNAAIGALTTRMTSAENRIGTLEEAGAINHLEEEAPVGELYTLSNVMFSQRTPSLSYSTLDGNVGDVNANKEIHIQRIGSGTATNQLKLNLRSVGSPTTGLVVEVRTGTQVTVTANSEAYWYGGTVIASGSVAYGNISNTYAEKTITLNGNFGGTKGQLLDVVVYQTGSVVNASNYYCVGCDSSQSSQGFRYVSVNGTSRTRSNLMPYCVSTGFADKMIVKQGDDISHSTYTDSSYGEGAKSGYRFGSTTHNETINYINLSAPYDGDYSFTINFNIDNNSGIGLFVDGYIDNVSEFSFNNNSYPGGESTTSVTGTINDVKKGQQILITYRGVYTSDYKYTTVQATSGSLSVPIVLHKKGIPGKPNTVESLGTTGYITTYGDYSDNKFYGGIMIGKSSVAKTGSITLGNAMGYIEVNFNGEIIKIPYYGNY